MNKGELVWSAFGGSNECLWWVASVTVFIWFMCFSYVFSCICLYFLICLGHCRTDGKKYFKKSPCNNCTTVLIAYQLRVLSSLSFLPYSSFYILHEYNLLHTVSNNYHHSFVKPLQELPDITPIHTHSWNFSAAVFMEFIATRLTPESI